MKMTTKGRYAVTALMDLALHDSEGPVSLADISQRQDISLTYLEQLFGKLRRHELIESARGPGGGYRLAQSADEITIAKIIYSVDEPIDITRCGGKQNCQDNARCLTHDLWMELNRHISDFLNSMTLGELVQRSNVQQVSERQDVIMMQLNKQKH
ncbi:MAG TPA: Fe-S cluster assembly transcriptional regulator IscR [Thiotrichaceae bacterium]|jgi:Rrf2 family iron-sulfur cluster assembly transcriptional regulator|nr:Fe-S cluster assembly transcriptional regulator IscR [Thiotrichaceae bacterium]HIM08106.1 Fe-S cluster assembly transcriptional regulator IscR [Gammaproteobacteria bacterium]